MQTKTIYDNRLGNLIFPDYDHTISGLITQHGTWEPTEQAWIENNVFNNSIVYNLGANIGYHSFVASKVQGGTGRVIAVEPSKDLCNLIELNCKNLNISNVETFNFAITDRNGQDVIYYSENNCGDNRVSNKNAGSRSEIINCLTMDKLIDKVGDYPDIIIMDIQGWETNIINQLGEPEKNIKILFEFTPNFILEMGWYIKKQISNIEDRGWVIKDILGNPTSLYKLYEEYMVDSTPENYFVNLSAEWNK
jgi:FkbM family methyltransferase